MTATGIETLRYAVRVRVVAKYLGQLGLMLALLSLVPALVAALHADTAILQRYLVVIVVMVLACVPLARLPVPGSMMPNEAMAITALAFILAPLVMVYPMQAAGFSFTDALFEAVSGVTTTGLTMLADPAQHAPSIVFLRAWMQWYGGLGFAVLSVALLMHHSAAARRLVELEQADSLVTTTYIHARRVVAVYCVLTLLAWVMLWFLSGDMEIGLLHALSAISTGGFSPFADSLAAQTSAFSSVVLLVSLAGAVSFPLYYYLTHGAATRLRRDAEWIWLLVLCLLGGGVLSVILHFYDGMHWQLAWKEGFWLSMSAQTTAGFNSLSPAGISDLGKLWVSMQMFIGGSVGSTAGGIKIIQLIIFLRLLQYLLIRTGAGPHAVLEPRLFGMALEQESIQRALFIILLFVCAIVLSWLVFLAYGAAPMDALFEVVSAMGTVGLSTGLTGTELPDGLKLLLCFDMLAGRLEVLALLVVFWPGTWIGKRMAV